MWVAKSFCDEHRVALDWLNEHTGEAIRFFAVVVKALRIGDSPPAPFLEVVAKPNDWQKTVRRVAAGGESAEADAYRSFWAPLRQRILDREPELLRGRTEPKSIWLTMNSPIRKTSLAAEIGAGELRVVLDIDTGVRESNLALLGEIAENRSALEAIAGELEFLEGVQRCRIVKRRAWEGKLLTQPDRQPGQPAHSPSQVFFVPPGHRDGAG